LGFALLAAGCAVGPAHRPPEIQAGPAFREAPDSVTAPARAPGDTTAPGAATDSVPAVAPADSAAAAVPAAVPPAAGAPRTAFWETLGDSTLTRLVSEGLSSNHDIRAAAARVREARANRRETTFDLAPTITVEAGYTRQRLAGATFPGFGSFPDQDIWDVGAVGFWEIDVFGRVRRNIQGQSALLGSAQQDYRFVEILFTSELAGAYFDLRGAQNQLAVARRNAENQRRSLEVTQQRLDAGRGTAFDTERARAQLSSTLAAIPSLEARVASAQYRIGVLVGRPPAAMAGELESDGVIPPPPLVGAIASPDSLVRSRPDVVAAERRLAAETAFVGAATAEYLPRLTVNGQAGYTAPDFDAIGNSGTSRYAVGPVISWPALNLGRVKARADAAKARQAEAKARYEQSVLSALQDVETSLVTYRKSRSRLDQLQQAAEASERAADLARLRFEGGVADFLQVLDAERTQLEAQDQLARGRTETVSAYVDLYRALGGTWPLTGEQPAR
jgi:NodT family efflux transporter outer membrane factor (OMF) lipoprotein